MNINFDYEKYRSGIKSTVAEWDKKLKEADPKNYKKFMAIIRKGSADMANYLINAAVSEKATIVGAYLDNLAFLDGIDFKADIRVAVMKEGKEILNGYSLKLYSKKTVGLANTTARGLCGHLGSEAAVKEFDARLKSDKILKTLISLDIDFIGFIFYSKSPRFVDNKFLQSIQDIDLISIIFKSCNNY